MGSPLTLPPTTIGGKTFPNVFVFPRTRIVDPGHNVLLAANLFNFKIDGDQPQRDHELWLGTVAAPLMASHPKSGARLIGLASRSGSDAHNLQLSRRRARNVQHSLELFLAILTLGSHSGGTHRVTSSAQGEHFAATIGVADGTEAGRWRSVLVTILRDRSRHTPVRLLPRP